MSIENIIEEIKELESDLDNYYCSEIQAVEYLLKVVLDLDVDEYSVFDIMKRRILILFVESGVDVINTSIRGGSLIRISNGHVSNVLEMRESFFKIFDVWAQKGWLSLNEENNEVRVSIQFPEAK